MQHCHHWWRLPSGHPGQMWWEQCSMWQMFNVTDVHPSLKPIIQEFEVLFSKQLGQTNVTQHMIDTGDAAPIKVPPWQIPFHYAERVHAQLQDMAREGIISPSISPWCAPVVYVPKSTENMCGVTKKDSHPVPRPEGENCLLPRTRIWTLGVHHHAIWTDWGYTDLSVSFGPCPKSCKGCVDNYVDDLIVFSDDMDSHISDLRQVLMKLRASFTLWIQVFFGSTKAIHLGFEYSSTGVAPFPEKTKAIQD